MRYTNVSAEAWILCDVWMISLSLCIEIIPRDVLRRNYLSERLSEQRLINDSWLLLFKQLKKPLSAMRIIIYYIMLYENHNTKRSIQRNSWCPWLYLCIFWSWRLTLYRVCTVEIARWSLDSILIGHPLFLLCLFLSLLTLELTQSTTNQWPFANKGDINAVNTVHSSRI